MSKYHDLVDLELRIVRITDDAIAVVDGTEEVDPDSRQGRKRLRWFWLPKSQIEYEEPDRSGSTTVTLPEWLATDKGLV